MIHLRATNPTISPSTLLTRTRTVILAISLSTSLLLMLPLTLFLALRHRRARSRTADPEALLPVVKLPAAKLQSRDVRGVRMEMQVRTVSVPASEGTMQEGDGPTFGTGKGMVAMYRV